MRVYWLVFVVVSLLTGVGGFFLGAWYQRGMSEPGTARRFATEADLVVLSSSGDPLGVLPSGTVMYYVPNPFGDQASLFKVYFESLTYDPIPMHEITEAPLHENEAEKYCIRTKGWLKSISITASDGIDE